MDDTRLNRLRALTEGGTEKGLRKLKLVLTAGPEIKGRLETVWVSKYVGETLRLPDGRVFKYRKTVSANGKNAYRGFAQK